MLDKHCRVYKGGVCNPFSYFAMVVQFARILYLSTRISATLSCVNFDFFRAKNNSEARKFLYFSSVSNKNTTLNITISLQNVLKI